MSDGLHSKCVTFVWVLHVSITLKKKVHAYTYYKAAHLSRNSVKYYNLVNNKNKISDVSVITYPVCIGLYYGILYVHVHYTLLYCFLYV